MGGQNFTKRRVLASYSTPRKQKSEAGKPSQHALPKSLVLKFIAKEPPSTTDVTVVWYPQKFSTRV